MKSCSYCGRENPDDQQFCTGCGTEFPNDEEESPAPETPSRAEWSAVPPAAPEPESVDLSGLDLGYTVAEGLSHPDWPGIHTQINEQFSEDRWPQAWREAARLWVNQLRQDLGGAYHVRESENFLLLSAESDAHDAGMLRVAEQTLAGLRARLGKVAWQWKYGKAVILAFNEQDDYYSYLFYFYPDGNYPLSAGVSIRRHYVHIALPFVSSQSAAHVLVHELTHNCIAHLRLPLWLNEGLSQRMESENDRRVQRIVVDPELAAEHDAFWNETNIQEFWAGVSFRVPGQSNQLSYNLGRILVEVLSDDWDRFLEFVAHADSRDAGQDAALKILDRSLGDAVVGFLGPGDWRPNRKAIAELWARSEKEKT